MDPGREILQVGDQHSDERTHHFYMGKLALFFMAIFTGHVSHYQRVICKSVNKSSIFCSYSWFIRKLSAVIPWLNMWSDLLRGFLSFFFTCQRTPGMGKSILTVQRLDVVSPQDLYRMGCQDLFGCPFDNGLSGALQEIAWKLPQPLRATSIAAYIRRELHHFAEQRRCVNLIIIVHFLSMGQNEDPTRRVSKHWVPEMTKPRTPSYHEIGAMGIHTP